MILASLLLASIPAAAQQLETDTLVRDIRPGIDGFNPGSLPLFFGRLGDGRPVFRITKGLMVSDGTPAGTAVIKPAAGEFEAVDPFGQRGPVMLPNGKLVFTGRAPSNPQPYVTDGTDAGTLRLATPTIGGSNLAGWYTPLGSRVYFLVQSTIATTHLWSTDGTPTGTHFEFSLPQIGTQVVADVRMTSAGGWLLFAEDISSTETRYWRSDGTIAGTQSLGSLAGTFSTVGPHGLFGLDEGQGAFFELNGGPAVEGVWVFDGQSLTRVVQQQLSAWSYSSGGTTFIADYSVSLGLGGSLYASDGTVGGTQLLGSFSFLDQGATPVSGGLAFSAALSGTGMGDTELWFTDGTPAGTEQAADIVPGPLGSWTGYGGAEFGGEYYFSAETPTLGRELYRIALPGGAPTLVADFAPGVQSDLDLARFAITEAPGGVVFLRKTPPLGTEPWVTRGDAASTEFLIDADSGEASDANIQALTPVGDRVFFTADDGETGEELWVSDGTEAGTQQVADLRPGAGSSLPFAEFRGSLAPQGDGVLFGAEDGGTFGAALWFSSGDGQPPTLVADLPAAAGAAAPRGLYTLGSNTLFFLGGFGTVVGDSGGLYRTDGTSLGTERIAPAAAGSSLFSSRILGDDGSRAYFLFPKSDFDVELFTSDGTAAGTGLLFEPVGPEDLTTIDEFVGVEGLAVFTANGGSSRGLKLYASDGSTAGTAELLHPGGLPFPGVRLLGGLGDRIVFSSEAELWITDGTAGGTLQLAPALAASLPTNIHYRDAGPFGYVDFNIAFNERRTVRTDGTPGGTFLVEDYPAVVGDTTTSLRGAAGSAGVVLYTQDLPGLGAELARYDGQPGPGTPIANSAPSGVGSDPGEVVRAGTRLFFVADDCVTGRELHAIPFAAAATSLIEPFGMGCSSAGGAVALDSIGQPVPGSSFDVTLGDAPAGSAGVLLFSQGIGNIPLGNGCSLYLPVPKFFSSFATDGTGATQLPIALPANPALVGRQFALQAAIAETTGPAAVALSSALEVIVGP